MKVALEFTGDEVEALGWKLLTRIGWSIGSSLNRAFDGIGPETGNALVEMIMKMQQSFLRPPQTQGRPQRGPFAGAGYGAAPPGADNVRPIGGSGPVVERCFAIDATRHMEAGIGCCKCATYNGVQRTECRNCGHKLCVIAPPPSPSPEPEIRIPFDAP